MKKPIFVLFLLCAAFLLLQCVELFAQDAQIGKPVPPFAGIHWAKGQGPAGRGGPGANMSWHGGSVMGSAVVQPIFWGLNWRNATFLGDKRDGLAAFYNGMGGSSYAKTTNEYNVGTPITYNGYIMDDLSQAANGSKTT